MFSAEYKLVENTAVKKTVFYNAELFTGNIFVRAAVWRSRLRAGLSLGKRCVNQQPLRVNKNLRNAGVLYLTLLQS